MFTYIPSFGFSSHLGQYKALRRVPYAIQYVPISYFILHIVSIVYIYIYVNLNFPIHLTPSLSPWYLYICFLCLCLYYCFPNKIIYTIFLDSTCMCSSMIFVFLLPTVFTLYGSLQVHPHPWKIVFLYKSIIQIIYKV